MYKTPTKQKTICSHKSKGYYVYRGGTDYHQSENFKKYQIAFFAEKISLARVYNEVTENKLNPTYKYYKYELDFPYNDNSKFLQEKDFIEEIQVLGSTGYNSPYKFNKNTGMYKRVSSSSSVDYDFFSKIKSKYPAAYGVWSGGEVVVFRPEIISNMEEVNYEDELDETPLFIPTIRGKKITLKI